MNPPPSNFISVSKTVNETISLFGDFSDFLHAGETAGIPVITLDVFSGYDPDPSYLLYLGPSIIKGKIVEQRFRKGLPGVVYSITFTLPTDAGHEYELTTRLAVLPDPNEAYPLIDLTFETSALYPIIWTEAILAGISIESGRLGVGAYYYGPENIQSGISILSGNLQFHGIIPYTYGPEDIQASIDIVDGVMILYPIIPYYWGTGDTHSAVEGIYTSIAILSGVMINYPIITYTWGPENIQAAIEITGGVLS